MFGKLFDRNPQTGATVGQNGLVGPKIPRHSGAWALLRKRLYSEQGLRVLDVGGTSPTNINFLTSLGHSVYLADLVADAFSPEWQAGLDDAGKPIWDVEGFTQQNLSFSGRTFDVVLLWTALDYLPEPLLVPVVNALHRSIAAQGQLLAFFHTKLQPEANPQHRYHVTPTEDVELQLARSAVQQRILTNRNVEKLFAEWSGLKQFLAKDGVMEAVMVR